MVDKYMVNGSSLKDAADAIRDKLGSTSLIKAADFAENIAKIETGSGGSGAPTCEGYHDVIKDGKVVRPDGWPDISIMPKEYDTLYWVVDNTGTYPDTPVGFKLSRGDFNVAIGYVEDGEFIQESIQTGLSTFSASAADFNRDYPVLKITTNDKTAGIYKLTTESVTVGEITYTYMYNAVVEVCGHMRDSDQLIPQNTKIATLSFDATGLSSSYELTSLASKFAGRFHLQYLDLSNWDASKNVITSLLLTFQKCYSLQILKLGDLDTSGWQVASMNRMFYGCSALKKLDLSVFKTSNWPITSVDQLLQNCRSLEELDVSGWSFASATVSSLNQIFYCCTSLKKIDLSTWDMSTLTIKDLRNMCYNCFALEEIDLSGFKGCTLSPGGSQYFGSMFHYCYSLKKLDLSPWKECTWGNTTFPFYNVFYDCDELETLDLSGYQWAVKGGSLSLSGCNTNLKNLKISDSGELTSNGFELYSTNRLTRESLLQLIDSLAPMDSTTSFRLTSANLAMLTAEEKAVATAKNWNLIT